MLHIITVGVVAAVAVALVAMEVVHSGNQFSTFLFV